MRGALLIQQYWALQRQRQKSESLSGDAKIEKSARREAEIEASILQSDHAGSIDLLVKAVVLADIFSDTDGRAAHFASEAREYLRTYLRSSELGDEADGSLHL